MDKNIKTAKNSAIKIEISKGSCRPPYTTAFKKCRPMLDLRWKLEETTSSNVAYD